MMPEKLYGSDKKDVIALVANEKESIMFVDDILKMLSFISPNVKYVKNDVGEYFAEMIEHEGNKYYYLIHSEEVMQIRSERENLQHARYSLEG